MSDSPQSPLHPQDLDLAKRALEGDADARKEFARRMQCVYGILAARNANRGRMLTQEDLEDVAQDVLTNVWRKLGVYEGNSTLESWVYKFCVLELMYAYRRKKKLPKLVDQMTGTPLENEAESEKSPFQFEEVYEAIDALPQAAAEVIKLKHFSHWTFEKIAERLGLGLNTTKTRYYRGLGRLRELLNSAWGDVA